MSLACLSDARSTMPRARFSAATLSGVASRGGTGPRRDSAGRSKSSSTPTPTTVTSCWEASGPVTCCAGLAARWLLPPRLADWCERDYSTHGASNPGGRLLLGSAEFVNSSRTEALRRLEGDVRGGRVQERRADGLVDRDSLRARPTGRRPEDHLADLTGDVGQREGAVLDGQQEVARFGARACSGVDVDPGPTHQGRGQLARARRERTDGVEVRPVANVLVQHNRDRTGGARRDDVRRRRGRRRGRFGGQTG